MTAEMNGQAQLAMITVNVVSNKVYGLFVNEGLPGIIHNETSAGSFLKAFIFLRQVSLEGCMGNKQLELIELL